MLRALTPLDLVRRGIKIYPQKTAVVQDDLCYSYQELEQRIYRMVHALRASGIQEGDHVAVLAPNTHQGMLSYYAVPWMKAVLVPLNTRLQPEEYRFQLQFAEVKLLLVDEELHPRVEQVCQDLGIPVWRMGEHPQFEQIMESASSEAVPFPNLDENDTITINFTSGTTSNPKGVMLTHRNMFLNALEFIHYFGVSSDSVYLHTLPMFHVNGWGGVWACSGVGATHVCLPALRAPTVFDLIEQEKVSHMCAAPTVLTMLLNDPVARDLPHNVRLTTAGSPPHAAVIEGMEKLGFRITHIYGLTEVSPLITIAEMNHDILNLPVSEKAVYLSKQGFEMLAAGEVRVVDHDMNDVRSDGEQLGEIVVQGNLVMKGYFKNPEATAEAFEGGFFHTGDIACVHPDGRIQIRDRAKDVIISGGENISSVEVESILYRHPAVREAAVVSAPDPKWGEIPVAFVALKEGQTITPEELIAFCRSHIAHYKCPKRIMVVDDLPKTASGKIQKFRLRDEAWKDKDSRVN